MPLKNAYARFDRAKEHIAELKTLHDNICAAQAKATKIEFAPDALIKSGEMYEIMRVDNTRHPVINEECGVLVGDSANSLRTALNYLVCQLAKLDCGSIGKKIQFPIEDSSESFRGQAPHFLSGLNTLHIEAIEKLQPYNDGCKWLANLRKLSNFDKHENLVMVTHDQLVSGKFRLKPAADGKPMKLISSDMKIEPALRIALGDGMPLIQTLEEIQLQVSQVLDKFQAEFQ